MKVSKKILASALSISMAFNLVACGEGEEKDTSKDAEISTSSSGAAEVENPGTNARMVSQPEEKLEVLDITIALPSDSNHTEPNEYYDRLCKELNEYLQMNITWEWLGMNDYYGQINLDMAAGDVADVMVVEKNSTFLQAAEEGLFWDLTEYIDDYDNLATIPQLTRENASYNGKMYGIPRSRALARNGIGYRLDWLNNLGLAEPTDWDSFYKMLYEFTYNDPDGNGVDDTVGLYLDAWNGVWDILFTWFGVPNVWGVDENGDLIHKSQTREYRKALAAFRQLYSEGLINNGSNGIPTFAEIAPGKARDEGLKTGIGGCCAQVLDDMKKVQQYYEEIGFTTSDNVVFTLQGAVDTGLGTLCLPTTGMSNMIAISTKTIKTEEQLRRVLQMMNDLNDGECLNLMEYGWEGLTYSLNEDGYIEKFTEEELMKSGVGSMEYSTGFWQVLPYYTAEENARPITEASAVTPIAILEQELYEKNIQYCVPNYGASYTSETYVKNGYGWQLDAILEDARYKYIIGEIDDAGLEEQLKTWWTAGGEQVTKEMNELYHAAGK